MTDAARNTPWVVVPCSGSKRDDVAPIPARVRYTGSLHRLAVRAALRLTTPERVRIASARFGLIELDRLIENYDLRIEQVVANADDYRQWRSWVHCDAIEMLWSDWRDQGISRRGPHDEAKYARMAPVIALTPSAYTAAMRASSPLLARRLVTPLADCTGIGPMRSVLSKLERPTQLFLDVPQ